MEILYSGTDMSLCSSLKWMLTDSGIRYETNTRLYKIQINDADEVHQILVHPEDWDRAARELDALTRQANRKDTPSPVIASSNRKIRLAIVIMMGVLGILAFNQLSRSGPTPCLFLPQTLPQPDSAGKSFWPEPHRDRRLAQTVCDQMRIERRSGACTVALLG